MPFKIQKIPFFLLFPQWTHSQQYHQEKLLRQSPFSLRSRHPSRNFLLKQSSQVITANLTNCQTKLKPRHCFHHCHHGCMGRRAQLNATWHISWAGSLGRVDEAGEGGELSLSTGFIKIGFNCGLTTGYMDIGQQPLRRSLKKPLVIDTQKPLHLSVVSWQINS